ncbi:MAG: aromatic ring-hydroxylating dioxygenase subunit alpha [Pseudomonadota bacterium]|mgnify:FL=1|nr:aromatic ring-hydroxylating dioxygenase subunit alpha [Pseudomonadota bacterium]MEC9393112.1 aromatic ring-hydroxylating dioxygenase subunit alpha [Pseudomonadota bacterium]MEC9459343.1 aromatic ring-hydroxylating dioxygenase subunit alpha [Pseudomonadota bacterium]MED5436818.1 aromatic ring-hydroxylating dioxygenase subunit alpha [Pseudomonadota bacterium]
MNRKEEYNKIAERVVSHVQNKTTDQANDILSIPTSDYTCEKRWESEMDKIFKELPLMLALSIEIPNKGDYKSLEVVGIPVLITRDKDSKVHAFRNVCSHRGAPLTNEEIGNKSKFTCPYHGWTYSNEGELIGILENSKFGELDKSCNGLQILPCEEFGGMIFVTLTPNIELNLDNFLGGMKSEIEHFNLQNWHYHGFKVIHGANWKIAFDGYLEGYHFSTAHKDTILPMTMQGIMDFSSFGPHLRIAFASTNIEEIFDLPKKEWWKKEGQGVDFVRTLFPNISISLGLGIGQIAQILPGKTADTNTTILHYVAPETPKNKEETAELDHFMNFLRDVVNDEDYALGLEIQKGLNSHSKDSVKFGKNERGNQFFHKYVDFYIDEKIKNPPIL